MHLGDKCDEDGSFRTDIIILASDRIATKIEDRERERTDDRIVVIVHTKHKNA